MWIDDEILRRCQESIVSHCWVPQELVVVLGASNDPTVEVNVETCELDHVPVLKRYGGGGTVVLHSGCAVVSLGCWVQQPFQNRHYFNLVNNAVIAALAAGWSDLGQLSQNGLSDLTYGEFKVAGTSLFRSRNYLLYQASILVDTQLDVIDRYLKHPSREPEYRRGRSHGSFLRGLNSVVSEITASACADRLKRSLPAALVTTLGAELIKSIPEQWGGLHRRAGL
jgi:lipoate-protein ligase A